MRWVEVLLVLHLWAAIASGHPVDQLMDDAAAAYQKRDLAEASRLFGLAVTGYEAIMAPDDPRIFTPLNNLAMVLQDQGDLPKARMLFERALRVKEKAGGPADLDLATVHNNLGEVLFKQGERAEGKRHCELALEIRQKLLDPDHPLVARSLGNLSALLIQMGDFWTAQTLAERALAMQEKRLGADHIDISYSVSRLASLSRGRGDLSSARKLAQRVLSIREKALGPDHPLVAAALCPLGEIVSELGEFKPARSYIERAARIVEKVGGPESLDSAWVQATMAALLVKQGDLTAARAAFERALSIRSRLLGDRNDVVLTNMTNLSQVYLLQGEYPAALALLEEVLQVLEKTEGVDPLEIVKVLNNLATVHQAAGNSAKARPLLERVREVREKRLGSEHPLLASTYHNLSIVLVDLGDARAARPLLERALSLEQRLLGPDHPTVANSTYVLAQVCWLFGEKAVSRAHALRAFEITSRLVGDLAAALSEAERFSLVSENVKYLDLVVALLDGPEEAAACYDAVLSGKGIVWRSICTPVAAAAGTEGVRDSRARLEEARRKLARLVMTAESSGTDGLKAIEEAAAQKEILERELASRSSSRPTAPSAHDHAAVQAALPPETALVDYYQYRTFPGYQARIAAFVMTATSPRVQRIDLGPAAPIQAAIGTWLSLLQTGARAARRDAAGSDVTRLIWTPVASAVGACRSVVVCPDRDLCRVPMGALPTGSGRFLVEDFAFSVLTSADDLIRSRPSALSGQGLLTVGGLDYDRPPAEGIAPSVSSSSVSRSSVSSSSVSSSSVSSSSVSRSLVSSSSVSSSSVSTPVLAMLPPPATARGVDLTAGRGPKFSMLPATLAEVAAIDDLFSRQFSREPRVSLRGTAATKESLVTAIAGRRIVHLATHGYWNPDGGRSLFDAVHEKAAGGKLRGAVESVGRNPLLFSGLALSGASLGGDKILSGEEAANLPLSGVELVVLSACETGLGELRSGEGPLGLRRAFLVAGARRVVSALWQVPDEATRQLLSRFYGNLWASGMEPALALASAQRLAIAEDRKRRGGGPLGWAGFVITVGAQ